jgi:hypothetical protein
MGPGLKIPKIQTRAAAIAIGVLLLTALRTIEAPQARSRLGPAATQMPFSFVYGGRSSRELLSTWKRTEGTTQVSGGRTVRAVTYSDGKTGLEVTAETTSFLDRNAVEWLLRMRNNGNHDTPIIEIYSSDGFTDFCGRN